MIVTLLVSTGASWESHALRVLGSDARTVVLKRCVDVDDLLAAASTGQAHVAVLGTELPGLDGAVAEELERYGVGVVAVAAEPEVARSGAARIGVTTVLGSDRIEELPEVLVGGADTAPVPSDPAPEPDGEDAEATGGSPGRVIAVHGPGGGPGRTTLAVNLAAALAARDEPTLLVDADPHGGAVAQHLGILEEVSGLLSAARLFTAGSLPDRLPSVERRVNGALRVLTGLPRPDRWSEVRPGALTEVVDVARARGHVVLDTGFSLEQSSAGEPGARPERNGLTVEAMECADEVLIVGAADPVGLARLVRTLLEVRDTVPAPRRRVVVNRMRPTLGWREVDVRGMLEGFGTSHTIDFLPEDQAGLDRALVEGRSLAEVGGSDLGRALERLAAELSAPAATR
ncbi:AAA family ATPase [Nocardioides panacisoli]|uniref:AAA family ATPase n=1 Tax=Nocardioides panacisoli TaxID=627624 RepID=UPI001C629E75|nr:AAA family ATPase [Nocardioides panacisoli]QYJ02436.1 AAA family ATPase [Nocardioides panacisoli]